MIERTVRMRVNPDGSPLVDVVTVHTDHHMASWSAGRWVTESDCEFILWECGHIILAGYLLRKTYLPENTYLPEQGCFELTTWLVDA